MSLDEDITKIETMIKPVEIKIDTTQAREVWRNYARSKPASYNPNTPIITDISQIKNVVETPYRVRAIRQLCGDSAYTVIFSYDSNNTKKIPYTVTLLQGYKVEDSALVNQRALIH